MLTSQQRGDPKFTLYIQFTGPGEMIGQLGFEQNRAKSAS